MTKDKLLSLTKYMNDLVDKLKGPIPEKHTHRPKEYHNFLNNEINTVKAQLEAVRLEGVVEKK